MKLTQRSNLFDAVYNAPSGAIELPAAQRITGRIALKDRHYPADNPLRITGNGSTLTGAYQFPYGDFASTRLPDGTVQPSFAKYIGHDTKEHQALGYVWNGLIHLRNCSNVEIVALNVEHSRGGGVILENCRNIKFIGGHIKHCRHAAIRIIRSSDIKFAPTEIHDCANFAPFSRSAKTMNWPVIVNVTHDSTDVLVCDAWIWGNYGEGVGSGQNIDNLVWQNLTIGPNMGMGAYLHEGRGVTMKQCLLYHDQSNTYNRGATPSPLLVINREMNIATAAENGDHVVEDCYFAPRSDSVGIDLWRNQGDAGQTGPLRIRRNVVVSKSGYCLRSNGNIAPLHKDTEFAKNIFVRLDGGPCYDDQSDGKQPIDGPTVRFVDNLWSSLPPAPMQSGEDIRVLPGADAVAVAESIQSGGKPNMTYIDGAWRLTESEPAKPPVVVSPPVKRPEFFVSNDGDNSDGLTPETAWTDWGMVEWHEGADYYVAPGCYYDPIGPDCGDVRILGLGCTAENPAVFHGGRIGWLPQCGRTDHVAESAIENGARILDSDITIDGRALQGFIFRNWVGNGIRCDSGADRFTLRNAELFNNGWVALDESGGAVTKGAGLLIAGEGPTIEDVITHDNGEDGIQSAHGVNRLRSINLRRVWAYNARRHSADDKLSFNHASHADGLQIYDGQQVRQLVAADCWFGPGCYNGVVFGDVSTGTNVRGVTLRDCTFDRPIDNGILNNPPTTNHNHIYDHVTVFAPYTWLHAIFSDGRNIRILDSVIEARGNCDINLSGGGHTFRGNHTHGVKLNAGTEGFGVVHGATLLPGADMGDAFTLSNYTPSVAAGSRHTRAQDIFELSDYEMVGPDEYGRYRFVAPEDIDENGDAAEKPSAVDGLGDLADRVESLAREMADIGEELRALTAQKGARKHDGTTTV